MIKESAEYTMRNAAAAGFAGLDKKGNYVIMLIQR